MSDSILLHIGIVVSDIALSEQFYTEGLAFTRDREIQIPHKYIDNFLKISPASDLSAVYLTLGGFTLELMYFNHPGEAAAGQRVFNQTGLTHLSIAVSDVASTIEKCLSLGATPFSQSGQGTILRDPDGQLIEILEMAYHREIEDNRDRCARR
jgi:lactoylglutathione lyase